MMGGDDDDGDTIVETQEISSENLFHRSSVSVNSPTRVINLGEIEIGFPERT